MPFFIVSREFPVEINNSNTHIDFILERKDKSEFPKKNPLFLICECKKANPALSNWCFVKAPFYRDGSNFERIYLESLEIHQNAPLIKTDVHQAWQGVKEVFDIAFSVKSDKEGEGDTKSANDAVAQVLRGMNGFINYLGSKRKKFKKRISRVIHASFLSCYFYYC